MSELPQCYYCTRALTKDVFSWDHVVPRCRGGSGCQENRVPACKRCNNRKGPLTDVEFRMVMNDNRARKQLITEVLFQLSQANLSTGWNLPSASEIM
jgi:5-methylcytosine-specific restriction endonuclease McrA